MSIASADSAAVSQDTVPAVECRALAKIIDARRILDNLTFSIRPGSCTALIGANGAGKSTLMKILSMLMSASSGELYLFGHRVSLTSVDLRRRIGLIGHQAMLYRDLSARENLRFFGRLYGIPSADARAMDLIDLVGLKHRANDPVKTFSRGMTQRVSIARALMHDPDLLLADEPFAGLDAPSIVIIEQFLSILKHSGKSILLANHDLHQSLRLCDAALVLRSGRLVRACRTDELDATSVLQDISA